MRIGLECLLDDPRSRLDGGAVGLVANPTTVNRELVHAVDLLHAHPDVQLRTLFGPEHGIRGAAQAMEHVGDAVDPITGLREISLYGPTFESLSPTEEQLADIDVLIFDIQDVGARYYTYAATMALCMKVAARCGVRVVVLDRPNPIGGSQIEGGGLEPGLENFCALYPVPQRHGMTVGELARLYNRAFDIGCELDVVACDGWRREQYFDETGLPWVMPSPNMPTLETAIVYPGMCLLEGTNISEARGTTRPFELFGAPFIESRRLVETLSSYQLPGVRFRAATFEPTFEKFAQQICHGAQIHVTDRRRFRSYDCGLAVVHAIKSLYPTHFAWRTEMYEYRDDVPAIDLLTGIPAVRESIDEGRGFDEILHIASTGTERFHQHRDAVKIY